MAAPNSATRIRGRPARRAGVVHRFHGHRPQRGRNVSRDASASRCSNSAATTRSSSTRRADLKLAVPAIVFGAVGTAGQRCTTTRRVLVHRSRVEELAKRLAHAYTQVRIGNPIDPATLMGPLIDKQRRRALLAGHRAGEGRGRQRSITGEKVLEGKGNFVAPTIVRAHERLAHRAARNLRAGHVPDSVGLAR